MKSIVLSIVLLATTFLVNGQSEETKLPIHFDKNIELIGYIIHLGDPEDNDPDHPISKVLNGAPADKSNPHLFKIFELAGDLPYDRIIGFFYALPEFPLADSYEVSDTLFTQFGFDTSEKVELAKVLVQTVNEFAKTSAFESVWTQLEPYRVSSLLLLEKNKPADAILAQMERFYQQQHAAYEIVPSLTIWSGPGWGIKTSNGNTATFVLGPLTKNYDFTNKQLFQNLAIHEFGHSFVNEVVIEQGTPMIQATENLFAALQESMMQQGYLNWETCIIEHFVRVGEVIIAKQLGEQETSEGLLQEYTNNRQFTYLPFLVDRVMEYRMQKSYTYEEAVKMALLDLQNSNKK